MENPLVERIKRLEDHVREDKAALNKVIQESELVERDGKTMVLISYGAWRGAADRAKRGLS